MSARRNPRWTAAETAALCAAYLSGGIKAATEALPERSVYSINCKAGRLGLKVNSPNLNGRAYRLAGAELEEALKLREQGWSMLRIGARFGMCETSASNAIIREQCLRGGYTPAERIHGRLTLESVERLRWMLKKGLKAVEIQLRLGISAASVAEHRRRYNAALKANGKALLPPPGNGEHYSGARVPTGKKKEVEALFLEGFGTRKVSERTGVSKTVCTRIRTRLVARLKRKGETLAGCDADGKRRQMREHNRHVPPEMQAKLRELILQRVPIRRAAAICGVGGCFAYKLRDQMKAEGLDVPKPRLPGKTSPLQREMMSAQAIPAQHLWRYRELVRQLGDTEQARAALRAEAVEAKRNRTFEDKLAAVAAGQVGIAKVERIAAPDPERTYGGIATGAL